MSARPAEIVIRPMTLDDVAAVVDIDQLSFPIPWPERSYRFELTENPASHLLVALQGEGSGFSIIGFVGFWLIVDEAHISTLAVHPRCRRMGVGAELLRSALRRATDLGAQSATLEVRLSNEAAQDLYRQFGFDVVGRRHAYYRDNNEDALLMTLHDLRPWGSRPPGVAA